MNFWVLGGNDAEMETIKAILAQNGERWCQPIKGWSSEPIHPGQCGLEVREVTRSAQGYSAPGIGWFLGNEEIKKVFFVEAIPLMDAWPSNGVYIDHHGQRAHRPASVIQVLTWIKPNISEATLRWVELIAANDSAHISGMVALGATPDEIRRVRDLDRRAQGITPEQEAAAEEAVLMQSYYGFFTIVRLPHSKCATVTDRLHALAGGPGYENLLILSPDEQNFFGDGAICSKLAEKYPGSWSGGAGLGHAGEEAYWGRVGGDPANIIDDIKLIRYPRSDS